MKFVDPSIALVATLTLVLSISSVSTAQETETAPAAPDSAAEPSPQSTDMPATEQTQPAPEVTPEAGATSSSSEVPTKAPAQMEQAEASVPAAAEEKKEEKKSWTDVIKVGGDFRYRLDIENIPDNDETKVRHRHRIRARLGVTADLPQGFKAEVRLATGSPDPVSTNQTLSEAFSSKPVWIDLAYGGWYPEFANGLAVEAGKMNNPFITIGGTELIFDSDVTPEGAALSYSHAFGIAEPFFHGAGFYVQERKTADDSWLLGVQGGIKLTIKDDLIHFVIGASYYDHTRIQGNPTYYDTVDSLGNSATSADTADPESDLLYDNDYNLVNGFFEVGGKIVKFPWAVYTDVVYNAAASDDNLGWLVGVALGKCKNPLDFAVKYSYRRLEADAVVGAFTESDFIGGGTNGQGHKWSIDFQAAKPLQLGLSYFFNQAPIETGDNYNRGQIDFKLKF